MKDKIRNKKNKNKPQGYIALMALLIMAAAALTIGVTVSLTSMNEIQNSFSQSQKLVAGIDANSCIEEGLERLRRSWGNYNFSLPIGQDLCIINIVTAGSNATLNATGTAGAFYQKIEVQVDNNLEILAWQEE